MARSGSRPDLSADRYTSYLCSSVAKSIPFGVSSRSVDIRGLTAGRRFGLWEDHQMDRTAVKGDEAGPIVKPCRRAIAEIDGELEPGRVVAGQFQGMPDGGQPEAAAACGGGQAEVDHLPDIAVGDVREQEHHGGLGLALD